MTLLSQIISDAFRESNLIAINVSPTTNEQTEALRLLNRYISALIGTELGELLEDSTLGNNNVSRPDSSQYWLDDTLATWYLPLNTRVVYNAQSPQTIYLHPNPYDGSRFGITNPSNNLATYNATFNGNGRQIESANSVTLATNGTNREWFYRADLGGWVRLTDLLSTDTSPFPSQFDDLLVIGLAMRLNPRNGVTIDPQTVSTYQTQMKKFKSQYRQEIPTGSEEALAIINPLYNRDGYYYSNGRLFDTGRAVW